MRLHLFPYSYRNDAGRVWSDYLSLRKRCFIDRLGWDLTQTDGMELDQYDDATASYSLFEVRGRVLAGARLLPFRANSGGWTHFIGDCAASRFAAQPNDLLPAGYNLAPTAECSRLVVLEALEGAVRRKALAEVVRGLVTLAAGIPLSPRLLSLSPEPLLRGLSGLGYEPRSIGAPYVCAEDGRSYRVLEMDTISEVERLRAGLIRLGRPAAIVTPAKEHLSESSARVA